VGPKARNAEIGNLPSWPTPNEANYLPQPKSPHEYIPARQSPLGCRFRVIGSGECTKSAGPAVH